MKVFSFMNSTLVKEWYNFAEMDLISANHLMSLVPIPVEIICYHCQQSAEKALKGYLIFLDIKPSRTHNIENLIQSLEEKDPSIMELGKHAVLLSSYAVSTRYPHALDLTITDANDALNAAKKIKTYCINKIE